MEIEVYSQDGFYLHHSLHAEFAKNLVNPEIGRLTDEFGALGFFRGSPLNAVENETKSRPRFQSLVRSIRQLLPIQRVDLLQCFRLTGDQQRSFGMILPSEIPNLPEKPQMHRAILKKTIRFLKKEDGPTAVEYAVMLALIIVVCIAAVTTLGSNANETFGNVSLNTSGS